MRAIGSALLVLMSTGCYLAHGLGDEVGRTDAGGRDAGRVPLLDAGSDAAISSLCTLVPEGELLVAVDDDGELDAPDIFWTGERLGVILNQSNAGGFEHGVVAMSSVDPALTEATPLRTISHQLEGTPEYGREYTHVQRWTCTGPQVDLCLAQDAVGAGDCDREVLLGWRFDGLACVPLYSCGSACRGADCDRLAESRFACESDRRECLAVRRCEAARSPANEVCGPLVIPSGRPEFLRVSYGGEDPCPCERPTCELTPSGPLELTATLSYCLEDVPDCDCSEPTHPFVSCPLPPLAPGTWTIRFDGREPITVVSQFGEVEPSGECR